MVLFIKILLEGFFKIFSGNDNPYCIVFEKSNLCKIEGKYYANKDQKNDCACETFLQRPLHMLS